jgi:hypothetical protein
MSKRLLLLITLLGVHIRDAANVFASAEVLMWILSYCDFPTVMSISRTNRHGRRIAQTVIRDRFRRVLDPYIPSSRFNSFVDLLQQTRSGVTGSIARQLLTIESAFALSNPAKAARSTNLNILAAHNEYSTWRRWFKNEGYVNWQQTAVSTPWRSCVIDVWVGEKPVVLNGPNVRPASSLQRSFPLVLTA